MLDIKHDKDQTLIRFRRVNRLNTLIAESVHAQLLSEVAGSAATVVLSFEGISFIDSSGFKSILSVVDEAARNNTAFKISDVSPEVYELIRLMKLNVTFEITSSRPKQLEGVLY